MLFLYMYINTTVYIIIISPFHVFPPLKYESKERSSVANVTLELTRVSRINYQLFFLIRCMLVFTIPKTFGNGFEVQCIACVL